MPNHLSVEIQLKQTDKSSHSEYCYYLKVGSFKTLTQHCAISLREAMMLLLVLLVRLSSKAFFISARFYDSTVEGCNDSLQYLTSIMEFVDIVSVAKPELGLASKVALRECTYYFHYLINPLIFRPTFYRIVFPFGECR